MDKTVMCLVPVQDRGNRKAAARLASTARKRRRDFNSFSDAKEQLQGKIPFSLLTASSLDGFVESCLNPNDSGGVLLITELNVFRVAVCDSRFSVIFS